MSDNIFKYFIILYSVVFIALLLTQTVLYLLADRMTVGAVRP